MTASRSLRAPIRALRIQFFVTGALFATLGVHVPSIKAHYALGERSLAFALLAFGIGSVVAVLCAGNILARHSPRRVIPWLASTCMAAVASLLLPSSYAVLLMLMLAGGYAASQLPIDAMPDVSTVQVSVMTKAGGLAAVETEQAVSVPLENALNGVPGKGGSIDNASIVATNGYVFVNSGYALIGGQTAGNVILAFKAKRQQ